MEKLYRGISSKYQTYPFTPSALRDVNIKFMEDEINQFLHLQGRKFILPNGKLSDLINDYIPFCTQGKVLSQYKDLQTNAFYAYFLSLIQTSIGVNTNRVCNNFCTSPFFTKNKHKDCVGINGLSVEEFITECFSYASDFFVSGDIKKISHIQYILHDYSFFQHFNHVLSDLDGSGICKSMFPTMLMDWTWDKSIITDYFRMQNPIVVSIDFELYRKIFPEYTILSVNGSTKGKYVKSILGFATWRGIETYDKDKLDWNNWDNHLMREQDGATIFWPWFYTIDDMLKNDFGKTLGFKIEENP
jgi:hypothetical protein